MVANKLTGAKGVLFTAEYVSAFEQAQEENKRLSEDNTDLHKIAVSDEEQVEREYQADKVRYSWRNIRTVLEGCDYKTIEDEVAKVVDFHTIDLKKRDRANYDSHSEANNTEYKQIVRDRVFNILDEISNTTHDGVLRAVTAELRVNVIKDKLSTTKRSTSRKISNAERKEQDMLDHIATLTPPSDTEYAVVFKHGFTFNRMYRDLPNGDKVRTKDYARWFDNFPRYQLPEKESWDVDWDLPLLVRFKFVTVEGAGFDLDNMIKSAQDVVFNHYGVDDVIIDKGVQERPYFCERYEDGEIRVHISNII